MLAGILPAPKNQKVPTASQSQDSVATTLSSPSSTNAPLIPPYPHRPPTFLPKQLTDFGDGGAYPEIHIVQYPLNMGKPGVKSKALVSVADSTMNSVALLSQNSNSKIIHANINSIKSKKISPEEVSQPTPEEEHEVAEKTSKALGIILNKQLDSMKPAQAVINLNKNKDNATYLQYTPTNSAVASLNPSSLPDKRIIKVVEAQVDPLEPPKHKHQRLPTGPPSPPPPVLHSPPKKLTKEDHDAWKIPPCISNWKNTKGFVIPLEKRLAADGRNLEENVTINPKFAMFSESLYIAERKAIEDLSVRNEIRKRVALKEREEREEELREMANRARMDRIGASSKNDSDDSDNEDRRRNEFDSSDEEREREETREEREERKERERLRLERKREYERELRLSKNPSKKEERNKERDEDSRDISEKIALGLLKSNAKLSGESLFDSRLFNQSSGLNSGFGDEEDYNMYSKPLFENHSGISIYRPKVESNDLLTAEEEISKLKKTARFERTAPVQFEKSGSNSSNKRDDSRERRRDDSSDRRRRDDSSDRSRRRDDSRDRERKRDRRDDSSERERKRDRRSY